MKSPVMFAVMAVVLFLDIAAASAAPCATCAPGGACVSGSCGSAAQNGGPVRRGVRRLFGRRCR